MTKRITRKKPVKLRKPVEKFLYNYRWYIGIPLIESVKVATKPQLTTPSQFLLITFKQSLFIHLKKNMKQ